jgi:hypothetical protein
MTVAQRLRTLFVCAMLEFASLSGMPMRPEQIEELTRKMNRPKLAHALPEEHAQGEGPGPAADRLCGDSRVGRN